MLPRMLLICSQCVDMAMTLEDRSSTLIVQHRASHPWIITPYDCARCICSLIV